MASSKDVASALSSVCRAFDGVDVPTTHAGGAIVQPVKYRVCLQRSQTLEGGAGVAGKLGINKSLISVLSHQGIFIRCQKNGLLLGVVHGWRTPKPGCCCSPIIMLIEVTRIPQMGDGPSFGTYV